jgi:hypothetical protein
MSDEKPVTGHFFQIGRGRAGDQDGPVPITALTKFRHDPALNLIYDSGVIEIYAVRGPRRG